MGPLHGTPSLGHQAEGALDTTASDLAFHGTPPWDPLLGAPGGGCPRHHRLRSRLPWDPSMGPPPWGTRRRVPSTPPPPISPSMGPLHGTPSLGHQAEGALDTTASDL